MQASMKIAVGLCFLAAMCASKRVDSMDDLLDERIKIRIALSKVETITRKLKHLSREIEEDTIDGVITRQWDEMDNYREYSHLLLNAMHREVNAAKKKGIDAQHCYDANSKGIDGHREEAYKSAEKCKETAEKDIQKSLVIFDQVKLTGDTLTDKLDSLLTDCHDINKNIIKACVNRELVKIDADTESYSYEVSNADHTSFFTSGNIVRQAGKCLNDVYVLARSNSESSMTSNSKCVKEAVENKKKARKLRRNIRNIIGYNLIGYNLI